MEYEKITPKSYPVNLIDKDWAQRKLYFMSGKNGFRTFSAMIHDMDVLEDDVWIVTNPKSGTTWMQELLWLLINDCDFDAAMSKDLELRSPFLEYDFAENGILETALKPVEELPSPRLIKSHLSLSLLPAQLWEKKAKVVYVFRNPKDAWLSLYYHRVTIGYNNGKTLEQFFDEYPEKEAPKRDPIDHATEFYHLRNEPWLYYTSFNRMKSNLRGVIEDLCKFLNKTVTDTQMERLLKHLSFEEMKRNPTTNHVWESTKFKHINEGEEVYSFVRSGKVNGFKDELKPELIEKADRFIAQRLQENNVTLEELLLLDQP